MNTDFLTILNLDPVVLQNVFGFFNSNFFSGAIGSVIGAIVGAVIGPIIALFIESVKEELFLFSDINSILGSLGYLTKNILGLKKQYIIPLLENYEKQVEIIQASKSMNYIGFVCEELFCPDFRVEFSQTSRILSRATSVPQVVDAMFYTKNTANQLWDLLQKHNSLIQSSKNLPNNIERMQMLYARYFNGARTYQDTNYEDTVKSLLTVADDVLIYSQRLQESLHEIGNASLLRKSLSPIRPLLFKYEVADAFKVFMPDKNHIPS